MLSVKIRARLGVCPSRALGRRTARWIVRIKVRVGWHTRCRSWHAQAGSSAVYWAWRSLIKGREKTRKCCGNLSSTNPCVRVCVYFVQPVSTFLVRRARRTRCPPPAAHVPRIGDHRSPTVETLGEYAFLLDVPDGHSFPAWERSVADYEASAMQPRSR